MAGIVFYFEPKMIDVAGGTLECLRFWNNAIVAGGGITDVIIINKTDMDLTFNKAFNLQVVRECPKLGGHVTKLVCPWNKTSKPQIPLWDFDHKTDWYAIGPANGWANMFNLEMKPDADTYVNIPMPKHNALHSLHAAGILMSHRYGVLN